MTLKMVLRIFPSEFQALGVTMRFCDNAGAGD
jgi:hypothetical protein